MSMREYRYKVTIIDVNSIKGVFPVLFDLFNTVMTDAVYAHCSSTTVNIFDREDVRNHLSGELPDTSEDSVEAMAAEFSIKLDSLCKTFDALMGATLSSIYIDGDYTMSVEIDPGRHWVIANHRVLVPKVADAVKRGVELSDAGVVAWT